MNKMMRTTNICIYIALLIVTFSCESESSSPMSTDGGGTGGSMARFAIVGDYLYTVDEWDLKLFNVSTATDPTLVKDIYIGFGIETIFPQENRLFIGSEIGMYIYDISFPENPSRISSYSHIYSCDPVVVEGDFVYVTLHSSGSRCGRNSNELQIVDISDPSRPFMVKSYQMVNPLGLGIDSTTLFVCDDGLKVYDVSNVNDIQLKHYFNINAYDVIPLDGLLMITGSDGFYQYSYANDTILFLSKIRVTPPSI